jgi:hypothetical protein
MGEQRGSLSRTVSVIWWLARFLLAVFLFVGALQIMKTGAQNLDLLKPGGFGVANAGTTFGLGWLGALIVLSGSPVAAASLTLVAAGEEAAAGVKRFTEIEGFTMLSGSRLGAAFVVLVTAVVFAVRGGQGRRKAPVSTAVIALLTTALVYVPAFGLGLALLRWEPFQSVEFQAPSEFGGLVDLAFGALIDVADDLPAVPVFIAGIVALLVSFKVVDSVLPDLGEGAFGPSRLPWLRRKWPMFGVGCAVALITMSVSVALTVLVPLVAKGWVRRDSIIPYIMGANITTLGDTLLAALVLESPGALRVVAASMLSTTLVSLVLLTFFYERIWVGMWRFHGIFVKSPFRLLLFTGGLFAVPIGTIALSAAAA